jgi:UDP-N-acetylmuramoyl-L-alanyl-D-glutamate--2,6-diaminopimelate ligase
MNLSPLLHSLSKYEIHNERDVEITLITPDSRQVIPGALFVAIPGVHVDGARFVPEALSRGAAAIVAEHKVPVNGDTVLIVVPDARAALAQLSAAWHGSPSRKLRVIGVTGTDGKTTTCRLIASILESAGHKVGTITTVGAAIGGKEIDTGLHTTTPDSPDMQRYLAQIVEAGADYAVIEATSEGLAQRRLDAVDFDIAVVTNITHEHLYYHKTWDNYRDAKALLFRSLAVSYHKPRTLKVAVLNADDTERGAFEFLRKIPADEQVIYTVQRDAEMGRLGDPGRRREGEREQIGNTNWIVAHDIRHSAKGLRFAVDTPYGELLIESPLIGRFNVSNILAAVGAVTGRRVPFDAICNGIANVHGVVGRMQVMQHEPFSVIVDFAHTPNALQKALETARELSSGRVIAVFGCAGLRDVAKRAMMGEVAGRLADYIVLTAEDPRTESVESINEQIAQGLQRAGRREGTDYARIDDRADAIQHGIGMVRAGDTVMICGKGHERSMCFGTTETPWSDQEAVRKALGQ